MSATSQEEQPKDHEEDELDRQGNKVGNNNRDRSDQTREVYFSKKVGIRDKGLGGTGETIRKIIPQNGTGHVEQDLRQAIGG